MSNVEDPSKNISIDAAEIKGDSPKSVGKERVSQFTQKHYTPTPYRAMLWEGIEDFEQNPKFKSLHVDVVAGNNITFDPMFERFDEGEPLPSEKQLIEEAKVEEDKPPDIDEAMIEEIRASAFEEGRLQGRKEFEEETQVADKSEYDGLQGVVNSTLAEVASKFESRVEEVEKEALNIAIDISKRVIHSAVDANPEYIQDVIHKALQRVSGERTVSVRVSPQDFEFLELIGLPDGLAPESMKISYLPDENIGSGCVVETSHGEINFDLDSVWSEIVGKIFAGV